MGALFSKSGKSSKKNPKSDFIKLNSVQPQQQTQQNEPYEIYDPNKYDKEAVETLRKEFKEDPETFVLNMLLMSMMFFDDYREEIGILANVALDRGQKLNSELIEQHQKQLLKPDVVLESVNKKVKFEHSSGPKKGKTEPLVAQRMFILHDTIEIERDSVDYSRIDKPCYRADTEESKENKGFVKVHLLGKLGGHKQAEEKRESGDSACSSASPNYGSLPKHGTRLSGAQNLDSGFTTESDYDYMRITAAKTPSKLQISEKDIYTNISQLPSRCIMPIKVKNTPESDSESDEEDNKSRKRKVKPELFITEYYLNSTEFMAHFKDNVFPNYLGEVLDFSEDAISHAMSIPGAVYCNAMDDRGNHLQYEVLPAIAIPWPDEIAFEWSWRRRVTVWDKREQKPVAYKWPTDKMIDEAQKLSCALIPRGFMPKKGTNSKMQVEWEVCFPKAEKYLELRMSHAQMRLFLYLITIYKTFIEPKTQKQGLLPEHIRLFMFWECEANYKAWPEDKLGTKLKMVLKNLFDHLSKRNLPHYFIRDKNVLENVPGRYILPTLEILNLILESPACYVLLAIKHLRYTATNTATRFYPEPNLDELSDILTAESTLRNEARLLIMAQEQAKKKEELQKRNENNERKSRRDKEQNWNRRYMEQQRNAYKKKLIGSVSNSSNSNSSSSDNTEPKNLTTERKRSLSSLNFEVPLKKRFETDISRQISLLTYFILHFLEIAKKSFEISSTNQTLFYLKQASYLTQILEDIDIEGAMTFHSKIRKEEDNCQKRKIVEPKIPTTPKRNSTLFAYQSNEILHVKGKDINIANLSKAFDSKVITNKQKPSTSGVKKKTTRHVQPHSKVSVKEEVRVEVHNENRVPANVEDEGVQLRQPSESKEIRKAVSFRGQTGHVNVAGLNEGSESTSL